MAVWLRETNCGLFLWQKIVAGITASACGLKGYHRKQEEFHVICVTSQLSLTPKLLNWHYRSFYDCNYEEFEMKADFHNVRSRLPG